MKHEYDYNGLGLLVKSKIIERGMTIKSVAEYMGIKENSLTVKICNSHKTAKLNMDDIYMISSCIGVSIYELLGEMEYEVLGLEEIYKNRKLIGDLLINKITNHRKRQLMSYEVIRNISFLDYIKQETGYKFYQFLPSTI